MQHEDLLKEIYEVALFLLRKCEHINEEYGNKPCENLNTHDIRAYDTLMDFCGGIWNKKLIQTFDEISGSNETAANFAVRAMNSIEQYIKNSKTSNLQKGLGLL